jgi:hypothetical protein
MAKKPTEVRRKLIEFDAPTWLNLVSRQSMKTRFNSLTTAACRVARRCTR